MFKYKKLDSALFACHLLTDGYREGCTVKQYQNACKNKRRLTSGEACY